MEMIARLAAIEEIKTVKARYFRGLDQKDEVLLREVFADDVELDYRGSTADPATGRNFAGDTTDVLQRGGDRCARMIVAGMRDIVSVHHASVPEIDVIDESHAKAIWPMSDRLIFGNNGPLREMIGYGYYHETYVVERGRWRIETLRLTRLRLDFLQRDS